MGGKFSLWGLSLGLLCSLFDLVYIGLVWWARSHPWPEPAVSAAAAAPVPLREAA